MGIALWTPVDGLQTCPGPVSITSMMRCDDSDPTLFSSVSRRACYWVPMGPRVYPTDISRFVSTRGRFVSSACALIQTKTPLKLTCGQQVLDEVAFTLVAVGLLEQVKRFFWSDQTRVLKGDEAFGGTRGRVPWAYQVLMLYATVTVRVSVMCELRSRS